jgi:hypothetical protein
VTNKNFVVKHGLVVGDTATINGVQIDPFGASSNQVLKFDGIKFAPAAELELAGSVHIENIGDGSDTEIVVTHNLGTRNVFVTARNAASPYEVVYVQWEATDANNITFNFSVAPASDSVAVVIYAAVTGNQVISYKETVGDGTSNTLTITHSLNTRDIVVSVRNQNSPYEDISCRWEAATEDTVVLYFSTPPANSSIRVGVLSI